MKESWIKKSNCCSSQLPCKECPSCVSCKKWADYVSRHRAGRGYVHFDERTSLGDYKTRSKVLNASWVAKHGFMPLISREIKRSKYVRKGGIAERKVKSPRIIRYCSHMDRCVYQRYAFLVGEAYESYAAEAGIDGSAIAYRNGKAKSTIDYAKSAFDFIASAGECVVLVADFESFFENVDHAALKRALCSVLNVKQLPDDYYAVFRNSTRYSCWDWKDLVALNGLEKSRSARKDLNSKDVVLDREVFRELAPTHSVRNDTGRGIPQGSPISSVLSNVYLAGLDQSVCRIVESCKGLYYRYCDDLFVAIPVVKGDVGVALEAANRVVAAIGECEGVSLQEDKTGFYLFGSQDGEGAFSKISSCGCVLDARSSIDYLGFSFDGTNRRIRAKAITQYHYKMRRKARTVAIQGKGARNLYGMYSRHARRLAGHRSFVDYAKKAHAVMHLNDPAADSIIRHDMEKIAKAINEQRA